MKSVDLIVSDVLSIVAPGQVLVIGDGSSAWVSKFHFFGYQALSIEITASFLAGKQLPFGDGAFDTVVVVSSAGKLEEKDRGGMIVDLRRISRRNLYFEVERKGGGASQSQKWLEQKLFKYGFRRHPSSQLITPYGEAHQRPTGFTLLVEKIPGGVFPPLSEDSAHSTPGLSKDFLRQSGSLPDSLTWIYMFSVRFIRRGDRVLDVSCGSGSGTWILRRNSRGGCFTGLGKNPDALEYARLNYSSETGAPVRFGVGALWEGVRDYSDDSFDFIVGLENTATGEDSRSSWGEIIRLLTPGGKFVFSSSHRDFLCPKELRFSAAFLRTKAQALDPLEGDPHGDDFYYRFEEISLDAVDLQDNGRTFVFVGMKTPFADPDLEYKERVFSNLLSRELPLLSGEKDPVGFRRSEGRSFIPKFFKTPRRIIAALVDVVVKGKGLLSLPMRPDPNLEIQYSEYYENPWIVHSLLHVGYRIESPFLLKSLAQNVLLKSSPRSADRGAALCVLLYRGMEGDVGADGSIRSLIKKIEDYLVPSRSNLHVHRWRISLTHGVGLLQMRRGDFDSALIYFSRCVSLDPFAFGVHLATKTTESYFLAGWIEWCRGSGAEAIRWWKEGLVFGNRLLSVPMRHILINPDFPNLFDRGDGLREYILALESLAKCANGLHCAQAGWQRENIEREMIFNVFSFRANKNYSAFMEIQESCTQLILQLGEARRNLKNELDEKQKLRVELESNRAILIERTFQLEKLSKDIIERTEDLVRTRADLEARTQRLEQRGED